MKRAALILACLAGLPAAAQDVERGEEVYQMHCAICHGDRGAGDGPMADILKVPPADLTRLATGNGGVFPTFRVVRQIDGRDPALAHVGEMPLFGYLYDFPDSAIASESGQPIMTAGPIVDVVTWLQGVQE